MIHSHFQQPTAKTAIFLGDTLVRKENIKEGEHRLKKGRRQTFVITQTTISRTECHLGLWWPS